MRTKFALAATTAGLIVAMGGYAYAEGTKSSGSSDMPAASSGSTATKSTTSSTTTAARGAATLQETKSDDAMAKGLNLRAKDLRDMDIYGSDGKKIAEVDHVLTDPSNEIKAVSADVGGFLGMGSREVVIPIEKLTKGSEKDRLNTALTKDQIGKLDKWADAAGSGSSSGSLSNNPSNTSGTSSTSSGAAAVPGAVPSVPAAPGSSATVPRSTAPTPGVAPNSR